MSKLEKTCNDEKSWKSVLDKEERKKNIEDEEIEEERRKIIEIRRKIE